MNIVERQTEIITAIEQTASTKPEKANELVNRLENDLLTIVTHTTIKAKEATNKIFGTENTKKYSDSLKRTKQAIADLNKMCQELGLEPITTIDITNDELVENFVNEAGDQFYKAGRQKY